MNNINFDSNTAFSLPSPSKHRAWIKGVIEDEGKEVGEIYYLFCNDDFLHKINLEHLQHDTLTDIITFDYCQGDVVNSDIFLSIDRIKDNAKTFDTSVDDELKRVMIHGILHLLGYGDKTDEEKKYMRELEDDKIKQFPVLD